MINILIADDHQIFIDGIKALLSSTESIHIIGHANNGQEAIDKINSLKPDVVLMDVNMPILNGVQASKELKRIKSPTKILILSMHDTTRFIKKLIDIGVDGYILKNTGADELITAINALAEGKTYFSQEVTRIMFKGNQDDKSQMSSLTEREIEILKLIASDETIAKIADILSISEHTVQTHKKNIMFKLDLHTSVALTRFVIDQGLDEEN